MKELLDMTIELADFDGKKRHAAISRCKQDGLYAYVNFVGEHLTCAPITLDDMVLITKAIKLMESGDD